MMTEARVINRLPQAKLGFLLPYQVLYKREPTLSHFRVFILVRLLVLSHSSTGLTTTRRLVPWQR